MRAPTGYPLHRRGGHWPSDISYGRAMRAPTGYPFHRRGGHWPSGVSCGRAMRAPTGYPFHRRGGHWPSDVSSGRAMRAPTGYPFHRRGGHWPSDISCGRAMRAPTAALRILQTRAEAQCRFRPCLRLCYFRRETQRAAYHSLTSSVMRSPPEEYHRFTNSSHRASVLAPPSTMILQ